MKDQTITIEHNLQKFNVTKEGAKIYIDKIDGEEVASAVILSDDEIVVDWYGSGNEANRNGLLYIDMENTTIIGVAQLILSTHPEHKRLIVAYIKKAKLEWPNLWEDLQLSKDNGGRWSPSKETPESVYNYIIDNFRSPSRAWPNSYATACLTQKFAKWLTANEPELAVKCGVAQPV